MILFVFLCALFEDAAKTEKNKVSVFTLSLLPYFVLMAFKDPTVGADTLRYLQKFTEISQHNLLSALLYDQNGYERIEKGYKLFVWLVSRISGESQILLVTTSLISTISLFYFIKENATNKSLALYFFITLGFFQFAMTGIRQILSISILLFAFKYIKERKLLKFLLVVLIAMQFHKSAIFFAVAYFYGGLKLNRRQIILSIIAFGVLYFAAEPLLFTTADLMNYDYGLESTGNGYLFFLLVLLITVISLSNRYKLFAAKNSNSIMLGINLLSLATWLLRLVSRTAERVSLFYMPYTYIALEQLISTNSRRERVLLMIVVMSFSACLFLRRLNAQVDLINFSFFFE